MNFKKIWESVLKKIVVEVKKADFITWFKNTAILSFEDNILVLGVPTTFSRDWLSTKYYEQILKYLKEELPEISDWKCEVSLSLQNADDDRGIDVKSLAVKEEQSKKPRKVNLKQEVRLVEGITSKILNPKYSLDNFIVGAENRLAHAASMAVANHPGGAYNPLFVYGGVGLGKTHLLQAIGNEILNANPNKIVVYIPSERFINEIVEAIGQRHTREFRAKYRQVDCLIVDDVQFFAHKEQTQIEFFHTFNELYDANKQIVISSDRPPKELKQLHDRLISRFEMGMIVDVQFPGYETKLAILQAKCREHQVLIDSEVLEFIATNCHESIRELEGVLLQAIAQAQLARTTPTLKSAMDVFRKLNQKFKVEGVSEENLNTKPMVQTIADILNIVANFYRIPREEVVSNARQKEVMMPRQVAMYLSRYELNQSYERIGKEFGGKNHTTVLHACDKILNQLKDDERLVREINAIKREMGL